MRTRLLTHGYIKCIFVHLHFCQEQYSFYRIHRTASSLPRSKVGSAADFRNHGVMTTIAVTKMETSKVICCNGDAKIATAGDRANCKNIAQFACSEKIKLGDFCRDRHSGRFVISSADRRSPATKLGDFFPKNEIRKIRTKFTSLGNCRGKSSSKTVRTQNLADKIAPVVPCRSAIK